MNQLVVVEVDQAEAGEVEDRRGELGREAAEAAEAGAVRANAVVAQHEHLQDLVARLARALAQRLGELLAQLLDAFVPELVIVQMQLPQPHVLAQHVPQCLVSLAAAESGGGGSNGRSAHAAVRARGRGAARGARTCTCAPMGPMFWLPRISTSSFSLVRSAPASSVAPLSPISAQRSISSTTSWSARSASSADASE